jgi:hypothetical protein
MPDDAGAGPGDRPGEVRCQFESWAIMSCLSWWRHFFSWRSSKYEVCIGFFEFSVGVVGRFGSSEQNSSGERPALYIEDRI